MIPQHDLQSYFKYKSNNSIKNTSDIDLILNKKGQTCFLKNLNINLQTSSDYKGLALKASYMNKKKKKLDNATDINSSNQDTKEDNLNHFITVFGNKNDLSPIHKIRHDNKKNEINKRIKMSLKNHLNLNIKKNGDNIKKYVMNSKYSSPINNISDKRNHDIPISQGFPFLDICFNLIKLKDWNYNTWNSMRLP